MLAFEMQMDGLLRTLAECQRRNLDMGPPLKQFGREKRKDIAAIIAAGRGFPPLAPSTLAKYEQRDRQHTKFTQTGGIRKSYQQRLEREKQRNEGLRKWAMDTYGRIPSRLSAKFQRFDDRMAKLQAESERRRQNMLFDASQVSTRERFAGQQLMEVRVMREGKRKLARIAAPGFAPAATVRLPSHLNKVGAVYQIPASALKASSPTRFTVGASAIMRTQKPEKPATTSSGGKVHKVLGRVPSTLFYKVLNKGAAFALIIGSKWTKDGIHNEGDGHVPKREHVKLESEDVQRLTQILVDYGIQPLKGGAL